MELEFPATSSNYFNFWKVDFFNFKCLMCVFKLLLQFRILVVFKHVIVE
jgi:hypothetical protein